MNIPSRNTINLESIDNASRENFVQLLNPCFFFRNLMRKTTKRKKKNENNVYRLASVACTGCWFRLGAKCRLPSSRSSMHNSVSNITSSCWGISCYLHNLATTQTVILCHRVRHLYTRDLLLFQLVPLDQRNLFFRG